MILLVFTKNPANNTLSFSMRSGQSYNSRTPEAWGYNNDWIDQFPQTNPLRNPRQRENDCRRRGQLPNKREHKKTVKRKDDRSLKQDPQSEKKTKQDTPMRYVFSLYRVLFSLSILKSLFSSTATAKPGIAECSAAPVDNPVEPEGARAS